MASLPDLLGHKLKVLPQRSEAKDYLDIVAILDSGETLERGIGAALTLYPSGFAPTEALRALVYFNDGNLRTLDQTVRARLIAAVDGFTKAVIPPLLSRHLSE